MSDPEIKVGQHWQEVDARFSNMPVREVVSCPNPGRTGTVQFRSLGNGRKSFASTHTAKGVSRFMGKTGGYRLIKDAP
jgi:hypothetical protein